MSGHSTHRSRRIPSSRQPIRRGIQHSRNFQRKLKNFAIALCLALFVSGFSVWVWAQSVPRRSWLGSQSAPELPPPPAHHQSSIPPLSLAVQIDPSPPESGHIPAPDPDEILAETSEEILALIEDLASDDIRGNALGAIFQLIRRAPESVPALEAALDSRDYQQSQLAAHCLREVNSRVSRRLIEVSIEALRGDEINSFVLIRNADSARGFLTRHFDQCADDLEFALDSECPQQAMLSALIIARCGPEKNLPKLCSLFIEHLADNDIPEDACHSASALYHLGKPALPYLYPYLDSRDKQQRMSVNLIVAEIEGDLNHTELTRLNQISTSHDRVCVAPTEARPIGMTSSKVRKVVWSVWNGDIEVPALTRLRAQIGRPDTKYDVVEPDYRVIAFGVKEPKTFVRHLTLRIHIDGRVERQTARGAWVPARRW